MKDIEGNIKGRHLFSLLRQLNKEKYEKHETPNS